MHEENPLSSEEAIVLPVRDKLAQTNDGVDWNALAEQASQQTEKSKIPVQQYHDRSWISSLGVTLLMISVMSMFILMNTYADVNSFSELSSEQQIYTFIVGVTFIIGLIMGVAPRTVPAKEEHVAYRYVPSFLIYETVSRLGNEGEIIADVYFDRPSVVKEEDLDKQKATLKVASVVIGRDEESHMITENLLAVREVVKVFEEAASAKRLEALEAVGLTPSAQVEQKLLEEEAEERRKLNAALVETFNQRQS